MKKEITVPEYSPQKGIQFIWENNFEIRVESRDNTVIIQANKAGLISLARHLLTLAQENVPTTSHIHLDDTNSLNEGSTAITILKVP